VKNTLLPSRSAGGSLQRSTWLSVPAVHTHIPRGHRPLFASYSDSNACKGARTYMEITRKYSQARGDYPQVLTSTWRVPASTHKHVESTRKRSLLLHGCRAHPPTNNTPRMWMGVGCTRCQCLEHGVCACMHACMQTHLQALHTRTHQIHTQAGFIQTHACIAYTHTRSTHTHTCMHHIHTHAGNARILTWAVAGPLLLCLSCAWPGSR
jgi:hypothetical protein